ncbi:MAG UNVERIFIED_CONTAM: hypothetical protein LVR18_10540 [Planctomycetaceae bacterium]
MISTASSAATGDGTVDGDGGRCCTSKDHIRRGGSVRCDGDSDGAAGTAGSGDIDGTSG